MLPLGVESLFQKGTDSRRWALGSFFWWLNTLMRTGFRRVLSNEDLYPIEDSMTSRVLLNRGQEVWKNADKTRQRALFWSTLWATKSAFAYCIFPRICLVGFRYAQPFLISRTVNFASSPEEPESIGWGPYWCVWACFPWPGYCDGFILSYDLSICHHSSRNPSWHDLLQDHGFEYHGS
jgi:hypothetical protein